MKEYFLKFVAKHGERIFFMAVVTLMGIAFIFIDGMKESGTTLLIAVATLALNKARSPQNEKQENK